MQLVLALLVLIAQAPPSQEPVPPPAAWTPQPSWPWILDVSSDGSRVVVARKDGVVELWDPVELKPLEVLEPALVTIPRAIALSPNGRRLAVLTESGRLRTWHFADADGDTQVHERTGDEVESHQVLPPKKPSGSRYGAALRWTPDGERVLLVDDHGAAKLCDANGRVEAHWSISTVRGTPNSGFTGDGRHVLTSNGERVEVRSIVTGALVPEYGEVRSISAGSNVIALAVHPMRNLVVTGHDRSRAFLWDFSNAEVVRELTVPDPWLPDDEDEVAAAAFSPDGRFLALSIREGSHVFLFDVETGEQLWISDYYGAHFSEPFELAWSPDSSRVWYAFACGGGAIDSHALSAEARKDVYEGRGLLPRFGGDLALTISWVEKVPRVMPVHPRR